MPANCLALKFTIANIQRTIDEDVKAQTCSGSEFENPNTALNTIPERHQSNTRKLRQHACMRSHLQP